MVAHVVSTLSMFEKLVGREQRPGPSVDDDPLGAFEAVRTQVEEELADPALADVEFDGFFGRSSFAKAVDTFLSGDLVTHRWDLAKATGGDLTIPPDEIERAWKDVEVFGDTMRSPGAFGPAWRHRTTRTSRRSCWRSWAVAPSRQPLAALTARGARWPSTAP